MSKSLLLIVNPYSGRGISKNTLGIIVGHFCDDGYTVTVQFSTDQTPEQIARDRAEGYDLVVCVGGDGTLSGVASGLMQIADPPPFGFIPRGTANDVASTLSLPRDPRVAAKAVLHGHPMPLDIGWFNNERFFTYIAAFGAFTGVSYTTTRSAKRALGHLAYVFSGIASMQDIKPQHTIIEHDGGVLEGEYIFGGVTNSTSIAGFVRLDREDVDLCDGLFEVILVKNPVNTGELGQIISSILNHSYHSENVSLLHTKNVRFTFDEDVNWTLDGENGGVHRALEIKNRRQALRIII